MKQTNYFDMEDVNIKGFCAFCKSNIPLVIAVTFTLFFTYGIRLFWYSIGIDTVFFMDDKAGILEWDARIGRFGLSLLSKLWYIKEFNPFTAFFMAFCNIWFFTVSWCYIIAIFSKHTSRNNKLIPFALLLMTSPVWAEQFYFLLQAAETSLMISICPYIIYFLYRGFLNNKNKEIVCAFILLVFMISVYQAIVPLFCCGIFACFLLLQEHSDYEPQVYRMLCLKLLITLLAALAVYFMLDRVIVSFFFHTEKSDYLDNINQWGQRPIGRNIGSILLYGYIITIGHIPAVQTITEPIMAHYEQPDSQTAKGVSAMSYILGNILLLPVTILFLVKIRAIMRNKIPSGRRLLYILAGIGVPLCIMVLTIAGGVLPPIRSLYALPLASAFMIFFLVKTYRKKAAVVVMCFALWTALHQAEISAQLFYSDQVRYNEDVHLVYELEKLITEVQPKEKNLPVALIGKSDYPEGTGLTKA